MKEVVRCCKNTLKVLLRPIILWVLRHPGLKNRALQWLSGHPAVKARFRRIVMGPEPSPTEAPTSCDFTEHLGALPPRGEAFYALLKRTSSKKEQGEPFDAA